MGIVKSIGQRIRQLRTERSGPRLTQEQLAERAEISVSFLSMIERGERAPHLETLEMLAGALEVPLEELFRGPAGPGDRLEPSLRPLVDWVRKRGLSRRDLDRLLAVAKAMFGS